MGVYKRTGHYASLFASNYNQVPKYTFNKTEIHHYTSEL